MRKPEKIQIIKNVSSSWFALGVNVVVGILLSPYIVHRLGDTAFGIWVLIFSLTGYYGLFDLGIRSSIVRYVSKFSATNSPEELAKLINTSLFSYSVVGSISLFVTLIGCIFIDHWFHIPVELRTTARLLLLMVGAAVALGFPLGVADGILEGLQKFYILNLTTVASSLTRAALIVVVLERGHGLLALALVTVSLPLISSMVRARIAFSLLRVRLARAYISRETFRHIAVYSGTTFMIMVAAQLKFKTDAIVIGTFVSAAAITYFNIGSRIVEYSAEVVVSLAQIFVPMSSHSDATGDMNLLRKIFVAGNRSCAFIIFPISATLVVLGKSIIEVWMGRRYVETSYPVLLILIVPWTLWLAQAASGRILFGMSKHGTWAIVTLAEGICNIVLSVLLVRPFGIIGDALGTAIPLTCSMIFFMPHHLCKQLGIRVSAYLREAYVLPLTLCIPFIMALLLVRHWFVAHHLWQLCIQVLICGSVYAPGLAWAYVSNRAFRVGPLEIEPTTAPVQMDLGEPAIDRFQQDV